MSISRDDYLTVFVMLVYVHCSTFGLLLAPLLRVNLCCHHTNMHCCVSSIQAYSVIKPVTTLIERSERLSAPMGVSSLVELATLRLTVAEHKKPLLVQTPRKSGTNGAEPRSAPWGDRGGAARGGRTQSGTTDDRDGSGGGGGVEVVDVVDVVIAKSSRAVAELTEATTGCRARLRTALDMHFFDARYNERTWRGEGEVDEGDDSGRARRGRSLALFFFFSDQM